MTDTKAGGGEAATKLCEHCKQPIIYYVDECQVPKPNGYVSLHSHCWQELGGPPVWHKSRSQQKAEVIMPDAAPPAAQPLETEDDITVSIPPKDMRPVTVNGKAWNNRLESELFAEFYVWLFERTAHPEGGPVVLSSELTCQDVAEALAKIAASRIAALQADKQRLEAELATAEARVKELEESDRRLKQANTPFTDADPGIRVYQLEGQTFWCYELPGLDSGPFDTWREAYAYALCRQEASSADEARAELERVKNERDEAQSQVQLALDIYSEYRTLKPFADSHGAINAESVLRASRAAIDVDNRRIAAESERDQLRAELERLRGEFGEAMATIEAWDKSEDVDFDSEMKLMIEVIDELRRKLTAAAKVSDADLRAVEVDREPMD